MKLAFVRDRCQLENPKEPETTMKKILLALLLVMPAFSVMTTHYDPFPKCFPCPVAPQPGL